MLNDIRVVLLTGLFLLLHLNFVEGAPFTPKDSTVVLERLPLKPGDPQSRELRHLRMEVAAKPGNHAVAVKLARRYFELVSAEGDPRYIGYAQAALSPWWAEESAPPDVLVLRASLKQYRHDFAGALVDLNTVIEREPNNAEALSLAATIHMVQGHYREARDRCQVLRRIAIEVVGVGCVSMLDALQGKARQAYSNLRLALERSSEASPAQRLWVLTRLGEIASRIGEYAMAEKHFREGLALGITDGYLLAAYADLLLDLARPSDVRTLLQGMNRSDLLLLRIALAEKALRLPEAETHAAELSNRFVAAQMRGDKVHQADEARFRLHVVNDSRAALVLAKENWTVQKETRDARILLESAIAAMDLKAAKPVVAWLKETNMEDVILRELAKRLEG